MPYMTNGERDYAKQKPNDDKNAKNRAKRNKARRELTREGKVSKGDGKDVDHKRPLSKGGGTSRSNLRVTSKSANRSFSRTKTGKMK
jgi:5-methylcytosine-specific restriction endonuclease McrA